MLAIIAAVVLLGIPTAILAVAFVGLGDDASPTASDPGQGDEATDEDTGEGSDEGSSEGAEDPSDDDADEPAPDPDGSEGAGTGPVPDDPDLPPVALDDLQGVDAQFGQLLTDVDRSERTMIAFQDDLSALFEGTGPGDADIVDAITELATERREQLLDAREPLRSALDDERAETVRESYLRHLESWAIYMAAVAEDPNVLTGEGAATGYTIDINSTADRFSRTLEEQLPDDSDAEVEAFAEGILDRGFRTEGSADV